MTTYYAIQRAFGSLRRYTPRRRFEAATGMFDRIAAVGGDPVGATYMEVGTGRVPVVPIALWLMGAHKTVTIDLYRYLCPRLTLAAARYMARNVAELDTVFGHRLNGSRLECLQRFLARRESSTVEALLHFFGIEYRAPSDAAVTGVDTHSIDYHVSYTVLEHISPDAISMIWREAHRILRPSGRAVHFIDYSDHFSHSDRSIDAVHFLRFTDQRWSDLTNNPFMYANRLRDDDHVDLARLAGFDIESHEPIIDPSLLPQFLRNEVPLDQRFRSKPATVLATTGGWLVLRPSSGPCSQIP